MTDNSTSGPLNEQFLSAGEAQTSYEPLASHGFNELVKVKRQGRWFLLKGLKAEFRQKPVYLELLKKEYELMVQLDHPNIVKAISKEVNDALGPCIVMEYIDGVRLDKFLETQPTRQMRRKVVDQLVDALAYIHSKQILHRDLKPSSDYQGYEDATIVYEGPLSVADGVMDIQLTTPYYYLAGNLLIGVYQITKGSRSSCRFYGQTVNGASIACWNENSIEEIIASNAQSPNFLPKTTFTLLSGNGKIPQCPSVLKGVER